MRLPDLTPIDFALVTRAMPAARSGASRPMPVAATARGRMGDAISEGAVAKARAFTPLDAMATPERLALEACDQAARDCVAASDRRPLPVAASAARADGRRDRRRDAVRDQSVHPPRGIRCRYPAPAPPARVLRRDRRRADGRRDWRGDTRKCLNAGRRYSAPAANFRMLDQRCDILLCTARRK